MELILNNHIRIKYHTTFCFVLAMYIFSIVTVSCRPSVDRTPPRPTVDEFSNESNYQIQQHQQEHPESQNQQKQQESQEITDESIEKSAYGDLHPDKIRQIKKCNENLQLMELCMRCAKVTKSPIVYPMCCDNEDNVKHWCEDYVYFGISY